MSWWLDRWLADVPPGDDWLSPRERDVLVGLRIAKRRADWRLGRWTAKAAVAARLDVAVARVEVLAAPDGAPEALLDGAPAPLSRSISHRAGRALAVVANAGIAVGCDLEVVEPRSAAFIADWLGTAEQELLAAAAGGERDRLANLVWTAKEAAAKARREGLRLDVRQAVADLGDAAGAATAWRPLQIRWADGAGATDGWWREEPGWVMAIAEARSDAPPRELRMRMGRSTDAGRRGPT